MFRAWHVGAAAAGVGLLLGIAIVAEAQTAPAQIIKQRQELMKSNGAAASALVKMIRGEKPYNQTTAHQAAVTINTNSKQIANLFPPGSGAEAGVKTGALPTIWQNKADFVAKAKVLQEQSAKLMAANDEATVKAEVGNLGKACGACHQTYRAKEK